MSGTAEVALPLAAGPAEEPARAGSALGVSVRASAAAFGAYFCMYGVRRPFAVASYEDVAPLFGVAYKPLLLTAQVLGYTVSKFIGIRVVAGMPPERRAATILLLVALAEAALVGFGAVPIAWKVPFLFLNGLPLGMVFGLVMGFLEGRRQSEAMLAGLCCSFIVADGVTKSVGAYLLSVGVPQFWMPAAAGAVFLVPLTGCVWALARVPRPNAQDVAARSHRPPMTRDDRRNFLRKYGPGLALVGTAYLLVTVLRSLRSDFATELWKALGVSAAPATFATSEIWVGLSVAAAFALLVCVRDNRRAFFTSLAMGLGGLVLGAVTLAGQRAGALPAYAFVVAIGVALYVPYVSVHVSVFERLLAATRDRGNVGFLMSLVDAFGYLGYVAVMLCKSRIAGSGSILGLFHLVGWTVMVGGLACLAGAALYFGRHPALKTKPQ